MVFRGVARPRHNGGVNSTILVVQMAMDHVPKSFDGCSSIASIIYYQYNNNSVSNTYLRMVWTAMDHLSKSFNDYCCCSTATL